MKKKDFVPLPPNWNGFSEKPVLPLTPSGGIVKRSNLHAKDYIRPCQLSDFGTSGGNYPVDIELIKDGERIKQIRFRCSCGSEAMVEIHLE